MPCHHPRNNTPLVLGLHWLNSTPIQYRRRIFYRRFDWVERHPQAHSFFNIHSTPADHGSFTKDTQTLRHRRWIAIVDGFRMKPMLRAYTESDGYRVARRVIRERAS